MKKMKQLTMAAAATLAMFTASGPAHAVTLAKSQGQCLAWDSVYQTAAAAMADWAFYGLNNFCGEPTVLNRSKGLGYYSSSSRPSMQQCINHVNIGSYDRDRLIEYTGYETWEMRRRGQNNKWVCKVHWTILD